MQVGKIDSAHKGKMENYLKALLFTNPARHVAKGAVFNGAEVVLVQANRTPEGECKLWESMEFTMALGRALMVSPFVKVASMHVVLL